MSLSADGRQQLQKILIHDEGLRLKAYKCTAGAWTIGVGHNLSARGVKDDDLKNFQTKGITRERAMELLDGDIASAERDCLTLFGQDLWNKWSETRRMGWINFLFQLGMNNAFRFKNTLAAALREDWATVRTNLKASRWYTQTKNRADRVIGLICSERSLYP